MNHNELYTLLIRYNDGEASAEEVAVIEELLRTNDYWKKEFEIIKLINEQMEGSFDYLINADTDKNWESLKFKLENEGQTKTTKLWPSIYKYAAAASIILVAAWFSLKPAKNEFSSFNAGKTYKTGPKEIITIKLEDGTAITLNQNSWFSVDNNFNHQNRLMELEGEAYFEVAKDAEKPFIVKTKGTYTKVLGTSFEIEANAGQKVQVSLYEGKVQFTLGDEKMILTPGEKLVCSPQKGAIDKQIITSMHKDAWVTGLSFKDSKLETIIKKLEETYKISIVIPANRKKEHYTVSFEGLDLSASIRLLEELTDSKITKKDTDYILNP
ncbi:MAG: FecR domain-containing protein [Bacteroidia bacterium]